MALAQLPGVDLLVAKAQARVGELLQARQGLLALRRAVRTPADAAEVDRLLMAQADLEERLRTALASVDALKAGSLDVGALREVVTFTGRMEGHLRMVRTLRERLGGAVAVPEPAGAGWGTGLVVAGAVAALFLLWWWTGGGR